MGLGGAFALISREAALLINNVLLLVACASVPLGTLYPLFLDALGWQDLGRSALLEAVFVPLMAPAVFLMGIGPLPRWKQDSCRLPCA